MDSVRRKQELLEKYWSGETSIAEEQELNSLVQDEDEGFMKSYFEDFDTLKSPTIDIDVRSLVSQKSQSRPTLVVRSLSTVKPLPFQGVSGILLT